MLQSMGSQKVGHDLATEQRTTERGAALSGLPQPSVSCDVISSLPASYEYEWSQVLSSEASVKPHKNSLEFLLPLQICGNTDLKKKKKVIKEDSFQCSLEWLSLNIHSLKPSILWPLWPGPWSTPFLLPSVAGSAGLKRCCTDRSEIRFCW